jgi:hypothetical protein
MSSFLARNVASRSAAVRTTLAPGSLRGFAFLDKSEMGRGAHHEPSHATEADHVDGKKARVLTQTKSGSWPSDLSPELLGEEVPLLKPGQDLAQRQASLDEYLRGILAAQGRIYDVCKETDLQYAPGLSARLNNDVYIKREDQQPVFSFKLRGAYNKIVQLSAERQAKGIVTCSAGNHAQGVALSCSKLGIDGVIVMPVATPAIKVCNKCYHLQLVRMLCDCVCMFCVNPNAYV